MICSNCGTQNGEGAKFCVKCGNSMSGVQVQQSQPATESPQNQNIGVVQQPSNVQQPQPTTELLQNQNVGVVQQPTTVQQNMNINNQNVIKKTSLSEKLPITKYFSIIIEIILKPFTGFKEKLNDFDKFKNSAILSLIISVIATFVSLIKSMISSVRVTSIWTNETKWVWENLKEINYVKLIGTNFLIYLGIIAAIACVYYIASLIIKKQVSFSRLVGISAISIVPMLICSLILSPLLTMIYSPLGLIVTIIGSIYTVVMIYETINNEILLDGNMKIYFNMICLSILAVGAYYLCMKFLIGSISSSMDDILNIFGV